VTLPASYTITSQDFTVSRQPVASGGSGDVYEGRLDGSKVRVKCTGVYPREHPQKAKVLLSVFPCILPLTGSQAFCKQAVVWKRLEHDHIVPLLGVTTNPFQLISEWMSGGNLTEHIEKHPDASRLRLVGFRS
jgi:serine/threonine protein kinase